MIQRVSRRVGREELVLEAGKLAKQADGAVTVQLGGTVVLAAVVAAKEPCEPRGFAPLTVDYREKFYAGGRIPGGFFKREGRPTEKEILSARLVDRPLRPLFPKAFNYELQIMISVLSADRENDPDTLALIASSAALAISDVPFGGIVGVVRVGQVDGTLVLNPTNEELTRSVLDLVVVGIQDRILMIEAGAREVPERTVVEALEFSQRGLRDVIAMQEELAAQVRPTKRVVEAPTASRLGVRDEVRRRARERLEQANQLGEKGRREDAVFALVRELEAALVVDGSGVTKDQVRGAFEEVEREVVRAHILRHQRRVDGRGFTDLRDVTCEVGVLPRTHGSGLFTRGQTQSLAVTTLGTSMDEQMIDAINGKSFKSFMLHYNFPPFSVGEVRRLGGPGRREIGHGALAERSLKPVMPLKERFPYTVRVVSEILESNGSSSMASVCGATLSLMDAGVPISAPVSGVAMGLVKEGSHEAILTDISGLEDHCGDMDFKVTGTAGGLTAVQMDLKIPGISLATISAIVTQAQAARLEILRKMAQTIAQARTEISAYAPRIVTITIDPERIRDVIGPGGKVIRSIIAETGCSIEVEDDGSVAIASAEEKAVAKAITMIRRLTTDVAVGETYVGKVKRITNFGAFCEVLPGKEGLIRISELAEGYVKRVEDEVKLGDEVKVKVIEIDSQGRINLSRKQALEKPGASTPETAGKRD